MNDNIYGSLCYKEEKQNHHIFDIQKRDNNSEKSNFNLPIMLKNLLTDHELKKFSNNHQIHEFHISLVSKIGVSSESLRSKSQIAVQVAPKYWWEFFGPAKGSSKISENSKLLIGFAKKIASEKFAKDYERMLIESL